MDPVWALLDDGACEVVERPAEEDSVRRIAHDVHLQVERDAGAVDDEGHVHSYPERAIDLAVRRFHAQCVRGVVNEVEVIAKVLADCYNLAAGVEDALDVFRTIAYKSPNRSQR